MAHDQPFADPLPFTLATDSPLPAISHVSLFIQPGSNPRRPDVALLQHHVERSLGREHLFLRLLRRADATDGSFAMANLLVGYGALFEPDRWLDRGYNGADREEPSCVYLKTCFRF